LAPQVRIFNEKIRINARRDGRTWWNFIYPGAIFRDRKTKSRFGSRNNGGIATVTPIEEINVTIATSFTHFAAAMPRIPKNRHYPNF
jgi:hypothetical protein